jgi:hypothetical protein
MTLMVKEWTLFLDRCIEHRIRPDLFDTATAQLHAKSPLPGRKLAALLLQPRSASASSVDPRVVTYLERLLVLKKVDASDVLASAFQYSKDRLPKTGANEPAKDAEWHNPPELEEIVFHRLSKVPGGRTTAQQQRRPTHADCRDTMDAGNGHFAYQRHHDPGHGWDSTAASAAVYQCP